MYKEQCVVEKYMSRWKLFIKNAQQEAKGFVFFIVLLSVFRAVFMGIFNTQLASTMIPEILEAMWLGFRLSLKTAGSIALLGLVFATVPQMIYKKWKSGTIRFTIYSIATLVLTLLFFGRIPYYTIFNSGYNMMLINGKNDDINAIINTGINEYHAIPFLIGGLVTSGIIIYLLKRVLHTNTIEWEPSTKRQQWICGVGGFLAFAVLAIFVRYGGAFNYANSINWESAARTKSNLLNEAILDDPQALYRVQSIAKRMSKMAEIQLTPQELSEKLASIGANPNGKSFDESFTKTITEAKLNQQPNAVYIILGESYGLWPFLPEFDGIGNYVVAEGKKFANAPNAMHTKYALAQGTGTMPAINGLLTGMPDVGLYPNYEGISYKQPYGLGIGPVMKQLGYKTVFWYGGFSTWQNVKDFALSQGFDEFHDASEMNDDSGNAWGVPDKALFKAIESYMAAHKNEKILNVIMTTSNHPPYSLNLKQEGFDASKVVNHMPDTIENTEQRVNEIGHFWYADHVMGEFITAMEQQDQSSIFVITGDHSERFTFARDIGPEVVSTIPIIFYGQGITPMMMPNDQFGMSIQIIPTLAELVGRPGQTYEAMVPSLFKTEPFVFNHRLWMDSKGIYTEDASMPATFQTTMNTMRELAAWRMRHGNAK